MTYLVAVSGGVDSVVLLDILAKGQNRLIVAHVDHGIREESMADARFVAALAKKYQLPFVTERYELGVRASEDAARRARYDFLQKQAKKFQATIVTAHHADDVVETIAINLKRGTGWRGLAVFTGSSKMLRPLLGISKSQIYNYALRHGLEWVEDSTNLTGRYLRNRLRSQLAVQSVDRDKVLMLRLGQLQLRKSIEDELGRLVQRFAGSRHFMAQIDHHLAIEILGHEIKGITGVSPMRPQLARAVIAIKTAKQNSTHHVGDRVILTFSSRKYQVSML